MVGSSIDHTPRGTCRQVRVAGAHHSVIGGTTPTQPQLLLHDLPLANYVIIVHKRCPGSTCEGKADFHILMFGNLAAGTVLNLALLLVSRTFETPLWLGYCVMACINGTSKAEPSILLGFFHVIAPLVGIPFFLRAETDYLRVMVAPVMCAAVSGCGYLVLARRCQRWRREWREEEACATTQRLHAFERERERLALDLHDTVGTALSLVALYSSLVQATADDPDRAHQLVSTIRDTARAGLTELRGVIHALPQAPITLQALASDLLISSERTAASAGARLTIEVKRGGEVVLGGVVRSTLVRIFQEMLHNALRHGAARSIEIWLEASDNAVQLSLTDNGVGFDPAARRGGAGLAGMQRRARELGGSLDILSAPGQGTKVQLQLPIGRERASSDDWLPG